MKVHGAFGLDTSKHALDVQGLEAVTTLTCYQRTISLKDEPKDDDSLSPEAYSLKA